MSSDHEYSGTGGDGDLTGAHQGPFADAQADRDRTLAAVRLLEAALARPAGGEHWVARLRSSLEALADAMTEEQRDLERPDSLLAMISAERPRRFGPRVRGIRDQYTDISRQLEFFRRELEDDELTLSHIGDLRHRAAWIVRALSNCRDRQADLVYEAVGLDLGEQHGR